MPLTNYQFRLQNVLQVLFAAQARDLLSRVSLDDVEDLRVPDLSHWVQHSAQWLRPIMLNLWQQGIMQSRRRVQALAGPRPDAGLRRHRFDTATIFGAGVAVKELARVVRKRLDVPTAYDSWDLYNPRILDAVDAATFDLCRTTLETATGDLKESFRKLRKLLKAGLARGEAVRVMAEQVYNIFRNPIRAELIAVTESSRAIHEGALMSAKDDPQVTGKTWVASSDACEACLQLDGDERELNRPFFVDPKGGPYAVIQTPPLHPRCMCSWSEIVG